MMTPICLNSSQGPLAEIEFWRDRNASLSTVYEQINQPNFQHIVKILAQAQLASAATLEFQMAEITKYYLEANDNVKFLSTLERHFKNIVLGSLQSVSESMPSLLNAIRMVSGSDCGSTIFNCVTFHHRYGSFRATTIVTSVWFR